MRAIDADAFDERVRAAGGMSEEELTEDFKDGVQAVLYMLSNQPTIQPEIIYCKDCKHFVREDVEEYTPYGYNTHFYAFCDKHWDREQGEYIDVNLDDFCSFAERRGEQDG